LTEKFGWKVREKPDWSRLKREWKARRSGHLWSQLLEMETRRFWLEASLGKKLGRTYFKNKPGVVAHSYSGGGIRGLHYRLTG
jgi:hypothetical protein